MEGLATFAETATWRRPTGGRIELVGIMTRLVTVVLIIARVRLQQKIAAVYRWQDLRIRALEDLGDMIRHVSDLGANDILKIVGYLPSCRAHGRILGAIRNARLSQSAVVHRCHLHT